MCVYSKLDMYNLQQHTALAVAIGGVAALLRHPFLKTLLGGSIEAIKKRDILLAVGVSLLSPGLYLLGAIGSSKLFWETLDIILKENNNEKFYYPRQVSNGYVKDNTKGCIEIQTLSLPIVRNDVSNSNINFTLFWNRIWLLSQILFSRL